MDATNEMLSFTEAAVVARVDVREVNRAIDERILPEEWFSRDDRRRVAEVACTFIAFYVHTAQQLSAKERVTAIREVTSRFVVNKSPHPWRLRKRDWVVRRGVITIDLEPFKRETDERMQRLERARHLVTSDSEVLGGVPVVRGTRIPVYDVAASVGAGIPIERIVKAYPSLDREKIELVRLYADAVPPRGRPRERLALLKGARLESEHRVPRRRAKS